MNAGGTNPTLSTSAGLIAIWVGLVPGSVARLLGVAGESLSFTAGVCLPVVTAIRLIIPASVNLGMTAHFVEPREFVTRSGGNQESSISMEGNRRACTGEHTKD